MTAQEQLGKLAAVRVPVEVHIGQVNMTVRDLLQLRIGTLLTLKSAAVDFSLTVSGVPIGQCESVRLERNAGVRITRVFRAEEA
jgi:flagellar motor switch/type III secretory pathway protein FliN